MTFTFPLVEADVLEFARDTARIVTADWLTAAAFTQPQLHNDYGSVVLLPFWLDAAGKVVLVIDAREIGQGLFSFYRPPSPRGCSGAAREGAC